MNFTAHWKQWIRPLAYMIYFILMCIAIPLCLIEVTSKGKDKHVKAWFAGGVFTLIAVPVSLWEILQHVLNYTQPHLQKYIIRILWMVPIYALNAWFALRFKSLSIYLDTVRECYEAYVIYNFMAYLMSFLWTQHPQLHLQMAKKKQQKHIIPFCCFPPWKMGNKIIKYCKHGVLQYTIIRPVTTIIALICELNDKYDEGDFNFTSAWSYLAVINNISQIWAMYCLVLFYQATKDMLAPIKPIPKFLCVKFVVFFSFWQAVVIAVFVKFDLVPTTEFYDYDVKSIATAIQDFCICIEMMLAAIAHHFAFSHEPFINPDAPDDGNCCQSFLSMWDVSDVREDVVEHVKVISTGMKKTVSAPFLGKRNDTETTPLLKAPSVNSNATENNSNQITQADVHTSYQRPQPDTISSTSDWEVTSVDRLQSHIAGNRSMTMSMQNYLENSGSSMENQSIHSQTNEHLGNPDRRDSKHSGDTDLKSDTQSVGGVTIETVDQTMETVDQSEQSVGNTDTDVEEKSLIDFESDGASVLDKTADGHDGVAADGGHDSSMTQTGSTETVTEDLDGNIVC